MSTVRATLANRGDGVHLAPQGYLGGEAFVRYRDATSAAGCRYDVALRGNLTSLDDLPRVVRVLEAAGFPVALAADLRERLTARAAALATVQAGAESSCAELDARLAAMSPPRALYPFQRAGVAWLRADPRRLLADDMGLGKTVQALCAAPDGAPVLVICPAVAKGVWAREAARFRPALAVEALAGRGSFRWPTADQLLSINYDILPDPEDEAAWTALGAPAPGTVVVLDEAQAVKSERTKRARSARRICRAAVEASGRAWALTGTPYENDGGEVYGILDVVGVASDLWRSDRGSPRTLCRWLAENRPDDFRAKLERVMLRREKLEVLRDLPPKTRVEVGVVLDAPERAALDALLAELGGEAAFRALVEAAAENADDLAEHAARAAESGDIGRLSKARADVALAKLPALLRRVADLERTGEPLIVMSDHRAPVDALASRAGWARISGDESAEDRTATEDRFQAGELRGVACSIRAAGVALTLTAACRVVFVDRAWNPSKNDQAEDRAWRIGQTRPVVIERLVANHPIDRMLADACSRKEAGRAATVEAAAVSATTAPVAEARAALAALASAPAPIAPPAPERERRENAYAGPCGRCGRSVAAGEGWLTGSRGSYGCEHRTGDARCWRPLGVKDRGGKVARLCAAVATAWEPSGRANESVDPRTIARRGFRTAREEWAARALALLAERDPDRALQANEVGFSASDSAPGWQLAELIGTGGLTDGCWSLAVRIALTYRHTQVGEPPIEEATVEVAEKGASA